MAQRNRRTSKKKQQLTYEDIKDLSPEQLEQMGLGSWLKDNIGNIAQTVGGGLMVAAGAGLTGITAGLGTPIGASLVAGGVGMMGSGASGFAKTAAQNESEALQEKQILNQNSANAANTEFQNKMNENPLESYGVTMRRGGKLPKYQIGGTIDPPKGSLDLQNQPGYRVVFAGTDKPVQIGGNLWKEIEVANAVQNQLSNYMKDKSPEYAKRLEKLQYLPERDRLREIELDISQRGIVYPEYPLRQVVDDLGIEQDSLNIWAKRYNKHLDPYIVTGSSEKSAGDVENIIVGGRMGVYDAIAKKHSDVIPTKPFERQTGVFNPTSAQLDLPTKAMGGTINYDGQLHEGPNGGVPVDAQGNPNAQNPVALVEKGEVKYSTGEGDYIFSDQLELRKGKTFARRAKDVQSKYKMRMKDGVIVDPIAKKGYDKEMGELVEKQEKLRNYMQLADGITRKNGGNLPKYNKGGYNVDLSQYDNVITTPYETEIDFGIPYPNAPIVTLGRDNMLIPDRLTPRTASLPSPDIMPTNAQARADFDQVLSKSPVKNLYQGQTWGETGLQMIPGVVSGISNILMARNRKRTAENMPSLRAPEVVPQQINLEAARAGVREQGNVARANTRRGLRGAASTAGQYIGNVGATETGVQRGVSEGLNQLNIQEETTNAGLRSSADALNAQMKARTQEINAIREQQLLDAYYNQLAGGIGQIGQGITGALNTKAQSSQAANMLQMMQPNYELTIEGDPTWGIGNKIRRTPRRG